MNIACISASRVPSSTANSIQVMKACQAISQLGHEVHLFLPGRQPGAGKRDLASVYGLTIQIPIEWLPAWTGFRHYDFAWQAIRRAKQIKADLVYVWLIQAGIISQLVRLPAILELHGPPEGKLGPALFRFFLRLRGKRRLLPITRALASQLRERYGIDPDDRELVRISPNGVDLERYADLPDPASARKQLGLPANLTVGYTGHLYAGRGMTLLTELARCFPQINFLWVGGSTSAVETWRKRLSAEKTNNIYLAGFVENSQLPIWQAAADILLMPYERVISGSSGGNSASYASPMKMFEYMASKRPIISSDLPVIREVLNHTNSILCPADDIEAWSQALGSLICEEEKRYGLAEQAWTDIQQYTWLERARKALDGFIS